MRWGIAAAALMAVVLLVPQTRTVAMAAMQEIKEIFVFADGVEVISTKTEYETSFAVEEVPEEKDYVTNRMRVRENSAWVDEAMHAEGVPTGDLELDNKLAN